VVDTQPRKWPRQERSRATFDAILEGCARLLDEVELADVTTNRIAERAGVGIGTLYEFFPSREAILAVLCTRRLEEMRARVTAALEAAAKLPEVDAIAFLLGAIIDRVRADRGLYRVLLRGDATFLRKLPETQRAIATLLELGRRAGLGAADRIALPHPVADTWLAGRMLGHAVVDVALAGKGDPPRELLTRELARLAFRMVRGRDPQGSKRRFSDLAR
jgi:AcrR family transcriptional regulator